MKKLYRKGTVHPSPAPTISEQLSFLPATILTLTLALTPEDKEVLAYLISCSSNNFYANPKAVVDGDHPPLFRCTCFRCYMTYWVRWDSSPNHQLIHEIIDAFEDWSAQTTKTAKNVGNARKDKRNKKASNNKSAELKRSEFITSVSDESESVGETSNSTSGAGDEVGQSADGLQDEDKGSLRRFVSFIGQRIWGAWGQ